MLEADRRFIEGVLARDELPTYDKLADIDLPAYDIDHKIVDLVRALISMRVHTISSCEGHLDESKHRYPWVGINPFAVAKNKALKILLERYNTNAKIRWKLVPEDDPPYYNCLIPKSTDYDLSELQRSAHHLALYIFAHRRDHNILDLVRIHGL